MNSELSNAAELMHNENYTCVVYNGMKLYTSRERGVKPLLGWLDDKADMAGAVAADKVVGKATAFLYVFLGVKCIYTPVISGSALSLLKQYGIEVHYDNEVPAIKNRQNTGMCPMESTVLNISEPNAALEAIRRKIIQLSL